MNRFRKNQKSSWNLLERLATANVWKVVKKNRGQNENVLTVKLLFARKANKFERILQRFAFQFYEKFFNSLRCYHNNRIMDWRSCEKCAATGNKSWQLAIKNCSTVVELWTVWFSPRSQLFPRSIFYAALWNWIGIMQHRMGFQF